MMPPSSGRTEDDSLLRDTGDSAVAGTLHARFVRSTMTHARLLAVDVAQARAMPGVVAAFAAAELDGVLPAKPVALATSRAV